MSSWLSIPPAPTSPTAPTFKWPLPLSPLKMTTSQTFPTNESIGDSPTLSCLSNRPGPTIPKPRAMVLCFDGTGNKFGQKDSNVIRFYRALVKEKQDEQIVHYQPNIGTYDKCSFISHAISTITSKIDAVVPLYLDAQIKEGYRFIVQSYRPGDKICLFGFSRGAHIARAIAGMIYKVGILPSENIQQLDFAFNVYATTGYHGYKLSQEFKKTFSIPVKPVVEFVGVWDTVSSVGIIPQTHPYTSVNYAVKTFRHALALDERRAALRPNIWTESTPEREQDLDVDIPEPKSIAYHDRDTWEYEPPDRDHADVKEVWFAGCHADVGGGSHKAQRNQSLSSVSLRWMIKECILARTGILFDVEYLKESLAFDFQCLRENMDDNGTGVGNLGDTYRKIEEHSSSNSAEAQLGREHYAKRRVRDICDEIVDQLILVIFWWIFELIPMLFTYQNLQGEWIRLRRCNLGYGRYVPCHQNEIQVHDSVKERIERTKEVGKPYTPKACNWDHISKSSMLRYVN